MILFNKVNIIWYIKNTMYVMKLYKPTLKGQRQFKMRRCLKILKILWGGGSKVRRKLSCAPRSFLLEKWWLRTESKNTEGGGKSHRTSLSGNRTGSLSGNWLHVPSWISKLLCTSNYCVPPIFNLFWVEVPTAIFFALTLHCTLTVWGPEKLVSLVHTFSDQKELHSREFGCF